MNREGDFDFCRDDEIYERQKSDKLRRIGLSICIVGTLVSLSFLLWL